MFQKNLIVWKLIGGDMRMEVEYESGFQKDLIVWKHMIVEQITLFAKWFQKNLIVWKLMNKGK